ncbi:stellacyanin [Morus notabilis]|uniref:stellacyanin n=1 Tax=Morus notabilis TaxID=981085 RepID=UPI000CED3C66|nr:stellacyanin [Morus notabilis]
MAKLQSTMFFTLAAILGHFIVGQASAFTHIVGGSHGWRVPENQTYFQEWAKPRTFGVGDRLEKVSVFPSRPCGNNVVMVSKEDFEACTQDKVFNMYYEGPTILNLTQVGDYYFYSGVGKHCEAGQKLHITVGDKEGFSGDHLPFKSFSTEDDATTAATSPVPSQLPNAKHSSATTIQDVGVVSASLLCFLLSLLI